MWEILRCKMFVKLRHRQIVVVWQLLLLLRSVLSLPHYGIGVFGAQMLLHRRRLLQSQLVVVDSVKQIIHVFFFVLIQLVQRLSVPSTVMFRHATISTGRCHCCHFVVGRLGCRCSSSSHSRHGRTADGRQKRLSLFRRQFLHGLLPPFG